MPKEYQCESCKKHFGRNKMPYKKHINHCAMPKRPISGAQRVIETAHQLIEKVEEQARQIRLKPIQEPPQQPIQTEKQVPVCNMPDEQRLLAGLCQWWSMDKIREIEYQKKMSIMSLIKVCLDRCPHVHYEGHRYFSQYLLAYPGYPAETKTYYFDRYNLAWARQIQQKKLIPRLPYVWPQPKIPGPEQHPLKYLLNDQARYSLIPMIQQVVLFPQQVITQGLYRSSISNFIASNRLVTQSVHQQLLQVDDNMAKNPSRYLLNKTVNQWQFERTRHLTSRKHPDIIKACFTERHFVIPHRKWLQLAFYYNKVIKCAPGATFLTELPSEEEQRYFSHNANKIIPPMPPQPIIQRKPQQKLLSRQQRTQQMRREYQRRKQNKQKKIRKKGKKVQKPIFKQESESLQRAIMELQSDQLHQLQLPQEESCLSQSNPPLF